MKPLPLLFLVAFAGMLAVSQKPEQVGPRKKGGYVVPTRQVVRPAGETVRFPGRPVDLALAPDGRRLYVKDNRGLVVLDAEKWAITQELPFGGAGGSMHGIAVSRDGGRVYLTDAERTLFEGAVGADGKVAWRRRIALPGPKGAADNSYPCGIALSPDEKTAFVCLSRNNSLGVVELEAGKLLREIPVGVAPFDVALAANGRTAWVSNWGGRRPRAGEKTAPSAETETLVDARGVARSGTVSRVDIADGKETAQIATGLHPSDLALSADGTRLAVANANSDTVSLIDTQAQKVVETIVTRPDAKLPFGSAPNALAFSPDGKTLFVANGGNNAVAVIALERRGRSRIRGFVPTGWYPGGIVTDGGRLFIANIKGVGSRGPGSGAGGAEPEKWNSHQHLGSVSRVAVPNAGRLRAYTAQVRADALLPQILKTQEKAATGRKPVPVPARVGEPSVFAHIVYVIKENRTYDQVFGDLKRGNGDPKLCVFPREVSPNHHALAEQFVLLDNFYCNGVLSADGHSWATEGNVTDHLEKAFGGFTRSYTFGDDPLTYSSSGFLWDNVLAGGLSFRNYGEMDYAAPVPAGDFIAIYRDYIAKTGKFSFSQSIGIENLRRYSSRDYPGWNMDIPDVLRADRFLKELKEFERKGYFPNLTIVFLPQDHGSGSSPGKPTPRAHMADNDLALGRVVEGISKSKFWPKTCIFVIEDDPQDGFDHVDGHRSLCLVVSPYTKRGAVVSRFYNQTSVLHTMQRMLGLPPLNQMDAASPLMTACFTARPNLRPYTALPNRIPLDERNPPLSSLRGEARKWAAKSATLRFDGPDRNPDRTLNRILWHAVKGNAPYPAAWEGAHGRGLKALRLKLDPDAEEEEED